MMWDDARPMNIPEGADMNEMPALIGWGSILSIPRLRERYFTIRFLGWRLFVARGNYGRYGSRHTRWWFRRERTNAS